MACRQAATLLAGALFIAPALAQEEAHEEALLPATELVAGRSQEEWSVAWWQWAGAFDTQNSPVADRTGVLCGRKQAGPVWFLAGTYGTKRTVRSCTVPKGRYLFFPLVNYAVMPGSPQTRCDEVKRDARSMTDNAAWLLLELDGVRVQGLEAHRLAPQKCFDAGLRSEERVRIYPSAANGYYVMLKPLSPGMHTLNFGGGLPSMMQAVTYTLTVE